jgi:hypothetical protein
MKLIVLTPEQLDELARLNVAARDNNRVEATRLPDGRSVIAEDLLSDCGPGQTFAHYGDFLRKISREANEGAKPSLPSREHKPKTKK